MKNYILRRRLPPIHNPAPIPVIGKDRLLTIVLLRAIRARAIARQRSGQPPRRFAPGECLTSPSHTASPSHLVPR